MAYSKHYTPSATHKAPPSNNNFESSKADREPAGSKEGSKTEMAKDRSQQVKQAPKMPGRKC